MICRLSIALILFVCFIASCTEDHHIILEKDGSASVTYHVEFHDSDTAQTTQQDSTQTQELKDSLRGIFDSFYKSPLIANYECKINNDLDVAVSYTISDVNELGKFLSPFLGVPVTFKRGKRSLTLDAGNGDANAEDDIGGYTNMMLFNLTIELPATIRKVDNSSGLKTSYTGNTFTMESSVGAMNYSGKRNLVVIKY